MFSIGTKLPIIFPITVDIIILCQPQNGNGFGNIQSFISVIKELEEAYRKYALSSLLNNAIKATEVAVLSYLSKRYYVNSGWKQRLGCISH
ncbi:hypothetical protein AB1I63_01670 [Streptococcus pneumoniae]